MELLQIIVAVVAAKAIIIGSEFSFYYLLRDGSEYWNWYRDRDNYKGSA